jgi:hypothetical protein
MFATKMLVFFPFLIEGCCQSLTSYNLALSYLITKYRLLGDVYLTREHNDLNK